MALPPGARLGPYEIVGPLGAGGMGEVYRARDSKLNREVALKILPDRLATDVDRLARFRREAQVLASLNHPNIGQIYGFEDSESKHALVLELIEGPTLADRIAQGPLAWAEAVPIAKQIAGALEAAHEQGIVHRDLKPANIKVRDDGRVKVLDFGLAKALAPTTSSVPVALNSPTLTLPTQMGVILGTAAYMAPEQAKGKIVDKRADIWAFGAVLYEMLTGQRAFGGEDTSDTLAAVLRQEIDWAAVPASTPAPARRLIARCLDRDVARRLRDIGEARILFEDPAITAEESPAPHSTPQLVIVPPAPLWRRALPAVVAAIAAGLLGAGVAWSLRPVPTRPVARFQLLLPEGRLLTGLARQLLDVSPDGRYIVVAADNRLYARAIADLEFKPIQGTDGFTFIFEPTFSPDGQYVAFYSGLDRAIKKIALSGGASMTICRADPPHGLSWDADGISFGQGRAVMRVSPNGGTPETLATVSDGEVVHGPQLLPGGKHVMFTLATGPAGQDRWNTARIVAHELSSGERRTVIEGGSDARYLSTGHIVYAVGGTLFAVAFDLETLRVRGGPVSVVEGVSRAVNGATGTANFAISATGVLVYRQGPVSIGSQASTLVLSDRKGAAEPLKLPPGPYEVPRMSPDGKRIAFQTADAKEAIIWIYDLAGGTAMRRLTFGGSNRFPVWSRDGSRVAFQSDREGDRAIFLQPADGSTAAAERLTKPNAGEDHVPHSWSPKSDTLLFDVTKGNDTTLSVLSVTDRTVVPFGAVRSRVQTGAIFSPDGRWVAYSVATPATTTLFVEPFPRTEAKFELVHKPADGPHEMVWSPDGKELFYNPRPGAFEWVSVTTSPTFAFGNATGVPRPFALGPPQAHRAYDIAPDGRFLGIVRPGQEGMSGEAGLRVVLNWTEELNARVPGR